VNDLLGITVAELVRLLKQRHARLPFEIGAFVALEVAERVIESPATPGVDDVRLTEDGVVSVYAPSSGASTEDAARSVVGILAHLLVAAGSGVPPVFLELVETGPRGGVLDLALLKDELEASLLPLNRSAARRVLSRLLRETGKGAQVREAPPTKLTASDVDDDLDALLGDDDRSPAPGADASLGTLSEPPAAGPAPEPIAEDEAPTLERELPPSPSAPTPIAQEPEAVVPASDAGRAPAVPPDHAAAPSQGPRVATTGGVPDLDGFEEAGPRPRGLLWAGLFLVLTVGLLVGVRLLRPEAFARMLGEAPAVDPNAAVEAARGRQREHDQAQAQADARYGDLVLSVSPERAQVLLFVGRGPAVMPNLPVGVAHEFVAIADGKQPTRAVVPSESEWSTTDAGSLYELAMQTGERDMSFDALNLGETRLEPDAMGQPTGELGSVRVLTTPPGAKVYYLIGFGPDVRVRHLLADEVHELLVFREGYRPQRVVVAPSDFRDTPDGKVAEASVQLERRRRR